MTEPSFYSPLARAAEEAGYHSMVIPDSICYPRHSDSVYPFNPDGSREFLEDKPFLEEIQANRSAGDERTDVNAAADSAAVRAQQIVGRMLLEERGSFRPRTQGWQKQVRQVRPVLR